MRKAKRAPAVTPAAKLIARQGADGFTSSENQDQLLASTVSSACSCIDITTATTTLTATTSVLVSLNSNEDRPFLIDPSRQSPISSTKIPHLLTLF